MKNANIPVYVLEIDGNPVDIIKNAVPAVGRFVIVRSDAQFDLWVTQGDEDPHLLCDDLGQYFYVPDVLDPPDEPSVSEEFALKMLSSTIRTFIK